MERGDHPLCVAWQRAWVASVSAVAAQWADADCTFVLRRGRIGWRIVASVEAHVDASAWFTEMYRAAASAS